MPFHPRHLLYTALCTAISVSIPISLNACQNHQPPHSLTPFIQASITATTPAKQPAPKLALTAPAKPSQPMLKTQLHRLSHNGISFTLVCFDSRSHTLKVIDQPRGPGTLYRDSATAAKAHHGIAAINAGFFTPEGKPLGLVIADNSTTIRGHYNKSSLGSGIYYQTATAMHLSRRVIWHSLRKSKPLPSQLLQSGPMLLENRKSIPGLSSKSSRTRSFIASDGKNHWCIGYADACTLAQLSKVLTTLTTPGFTPTTALNLDGGRSSDLWVSSHIHGGPTTKRGFLNKSVRNFLVLSKR